jgi:hypothetical protein
MVVLTPDAQSIASFLTAGARLQEFADGATGVEMFAIIEIALSSSGTAEARILRSSGLSAFDDWVLASSQAVLEGHILDAGAEQSKGSRSLWRFDGRVQFRRRLSALDGGVGRAALGVLAMAGISALSSINHETTSSGTQQEGPPRPLGPRMPGFEGRVGEEGLSIVDLSNPSYQCTVTLLEVE